MSTFNFLVLDTIQDYWFFMFGNWRYQLLQFCKGNVCPFLVYTRFKLLNSLWPPLSDSPLQDAPHIFNRRQIWGRCGSGGRAVVWQSEGCRFDPTLGVSKCPWARHLTPNCSWRAGWYLAWQPIAVGVWMCVWMGEWEAKNCKALWIKALYKCSPFTIYHLDCRQASQAHTLRCCNLCRMRPGIVLLK